MLPSPSPQLTATEVWGPVLAWCVLDWLAESIDPLDPQRTALELFDRLRLREPFGHAFAALGFKGEEAWRAAARIKVLLLARTDASLGDASTPADVDLVAPDSSPAVPAASTLPEASAPAPTSETGEGKTAPSTPQPAQEQVALAPALWLDPDVRWLCGVHEAEGHFYLVREQYEALLWWLLLPSLLRLAGEPVPSRAAAEELSKTVAAALHSAEAAGYRVNTLLGPLAVPETVESPAPEPEPAGTSATAPEPEA